MYSKKCYINALYSVIQTLLYYKGKIMKKRKNQRELETVPLQNPVAKFAHQFNKAQTFRDKSKYSRKAKHARQEVFPIPRLGGIGKTSCFNSSAAPNVF
jgi:hypothetical protein